MNKKKTILNVLYQSNDSYAAITGVSMYSLLTNNTDLDQLTIYLLDDHISKENLKKFRELCKQYKRTLHILNGDTYLQKCKKLKLTPYKGTYTTYFKLFTFGSIKTSNDMLLQIDGDTIITGSLSGLCDLDMSQSVIAATYDCINNDYKKTIGMPLDGGYYNCGVLYVNQKLWRGQKYEQQIVDHLTQVRNQYFIVDQDIINVLFYDKIKYLDLTYNFNCGFYIYGIDNIEKIYKLRYPYFHKKSLIQKRIKNPLIIHCMGAMTGRPWEKDSIHPQNDLFDKYLLQSPWKSFKKRTPKRALTFKIQRSLYQLLPRGIYSYIHRWVQHLYLSKNNRGCQE